MDNNMDNLKPSAIARWHAKRRMRTKGQIQLFETIAVLMVFFVIVGFGMAFYFYISKESAIKEHRRALELNAITTAQKVSTLPELDCIQVGVHLEKCFDTLKMNSFAKILNDPNMQAKDAYFDTTGYSKLTVMKIFPTGGQVDIYDNKPADSVSTEKTFLPINTYDPLTKTYGFAMLEVSFYER